MIRVRHAASSGQETILQVFHFNTSTLCAETRSAQLSLSPSLLTSSSVILAPQEAHAMQEKVSAQYKNEIYMAKAQRDYELKKAAYDIEVNTKKAESEMAYQLQVFACSCQR